MEIGSFGSGPEVDRLVAISEVKISPVDGQLEPTMYRSVAILRQQLVARLGGLPESEQTPPGNILVPLLI